MSLSSPKLVDKTWDQLVQEAITRIQGKCPEWTDFNASDPGRALIEVMAWMTEVMLYRLNQVPEQTYVKFLEFLGEKQRLASPARMWVACSCEGTQRPADMMTLLKGSRVSAILADRDPVYFEVETDTTLTCAQLVKVGTKAGTQVHVHRQLSEENVASPDKPIKIFLEEKETEKHKEEQEESPKDEPPHCVYFGDDALGELNVPHRLELTFRVVDKQIEEWRPSQHGDTNRIEWSQWDGKQWIPLNPLEDRTGNWQRDGTVVFEPFLAIQKHEVSGTTTYWLRAELVKIHEYSLPTIQDVTWRRMSLPHYVMNSAKVQVMSVPRSDEELGVQVAQHPLQAIDISQEFYPFGKKPGSGSELRLSHPWLQYIAGTIEITINVAGEVGWPDEKIKWEFFDSRQQQWIFFSPQPLRSLKAEDISPDESSRMPSNMRSVKLHWSISKSQEKSHAADKIRARLNDTMDEEEGPRLSGIQIAFTEDARPWVSLKTKNNAETIDVRNARKDPQGWQPFVLDMERQPTCYLGFDGPLPQPSHSLAFILQDEGSITPLQARWEYWNGNHWHDISPKNQDDGTCGFSRSGAVRFKIPSDWFACLEFEVELHWLRVRVMEDRDVDKVKIKRIEINVVPIVQQETIDKEILGSGTGQPAQQVSLAHQFVAGAPIIEVYEQKEGINSILEQGSPVLSGVNRPWQPWEIVPNFLHSKSDDRHIIHDAITGTVTFGNGQNGRIPAIGRENIRASYSITKGILGNVAREATISLDADLEGVLRIKEVRPILSAGGGTNPESVDEVKLRGPWILKDRDRAVTLVDFERLAQKASNQVAKAIAYADGEDICVVILPKNHRLKGDQKDDQIDPLLPSAGLIHTVWKYLDARRLIGTKLKVIGPTYLPLFLKIEVAIKPLHLGEGFKKIEDHVTSALHRFVDPLAGGDGKDGWPMGRTLHLSELYYLVERIPEIDFVEKILIDVLPNLQMERSKISIPDRTFPIFRKIVVVRNSEKSSGE